MKWRILAAVSLGIIVLANPAFAQNAQQPQSLAELISSLYNGSVRVVGLAAFLMLLYAGMVRMGIIPNTKPEDSTAIIQDAIIGTVLLLSAVIILNSINPDLTNQPESFEDRLELYYRGDARP